MQAQFQEKRSDSAPDFSFFPGKNPKFLMTKRSQGLISG
jgi:hypothetical protein